MTIAEKAAERAGVLAVRLTDAQQRVTKLELNLRAIQQIAANAVHDGVEKGTVRWREALEKIIDLSR